MGLIIGSAPGPSGSGQASASVTRIEFVCPLCKDEMDRRPDAYYCARDQRAYPIVFDIPDFRVFPDSFGEHDTEAHKAAPMLAEYPRRTSAGLMEFYYQLTPELPASLTETYLRHARSGVARAQDALAEIQEYGRSIMRGPFLEVGCGGGDFLVAAASVYDQVVGVDIGLHWLIIAKKQLEEAGRHATLVCACAEALPFSDNSFQVAAARDVIEHVRRQLDLLQETHRVLADNGILFLATPNRWSLSPEPHVKVWGVGFLPRAWRDPYVRMIRKIPYENISTLNYFDIRSLLARANFARWEIWPPTLHPEHTAAMPAWKRAAVPIYHALKDLPLVKWVVRLFGPLFHVVCVKTDPKRGSVQIA